MHWRNPLPTRLQILSILDLNLSGLDGICLVVLKQINISKILNCIRGYLHHLYESPLLLWNFAKFFTAHASNQNILIQFCQFYPYFWDENRGQCKIVKEGH